MWHHISVHEHYVIQPAKAEHIEYLPAIELAAARLLVGHAPEHVLQETTDAAVLRFAVEERRLWVASLNDEPVGFAHVELLKDQSAHLEEIDVHPRHGQRGIGTALVRGICSWTIARGFRRLTLTTFRAPRWNMPFYARLGFVEVPRGEWTAELTRIVANETARGLDPASRLVMAWSA
jgi:GNAT superfamily N-acetyltransferase